MKCWRAAWGSGSLRRAGAREPLCGCRPLLAPAAVGGPGPTWATPAGRIGASASAPTASLRRLSMARRWACHGAVCCKRAGQAVSSSVRPSGLCEQAGRFHGRRAAGWRRLRAATAPLPGLLLLLAREQVRPRASSNGGLAGWFTAGLVTEAGQALRRHRPAAARCSGQLAAGRGAEVAAWETAASPSCRPLPAQRRAPTRPC